MASRTGFVYTERFLDHKTGLGHPERPERLRAIVSRLKEVKLASSLEPISIEPASEEWMSKVHTPAHIRFVRETCLRGGILDGGDTPVSKDSYEVALLAAGAVIAAVAAVLNGGMENAFCAVRPPGHHATQAVSMGFCLFNNAAIGARFAQAAHGLKRVAIIDWDVHHGNGTQEIFYEDKSVFYISTHQYPFYPGTGSRTETGSGEGKGYTLNIPMSAGSGEKEYLDAFRGEILPALDRYRPELIMISAGFDAHRDDPLANINLTEESFSKLTLLISESARRNCNGKIVSVLEGGYHLTALARSVEAHLRVFTGKHS
ncbi:MAG: histone deacetylase [Ignavibacteria bacterium]|nr:MAG: histone deacetylase [Ignavibacteria bacterium]